MRVSEKDPGPVRGKQRAHALLWEGCLPPLLPGKHLGLEPAAFQGWARTGQAAGKPTPPPCPQGSESPCEQGRSHGVENQNPGSRLACPDAQMELQASPLGYPRGFMVPSPTRLRSGNQARLAGTK